MALPIIIVLLLFTYPARGESFSIENILSVKTPVPGGRWYFLGTNLPVYLGGGVVAFRAAGWEEQAGIYTY